MAEKLVSPGVFTRENDLSFIAQGVGEIGAAIVGPFKQGPAFKPTIITTQSELTDVFGAADGTYYKELTAQNYLREDGVVKICRVAGIGGYTDVDATYLVATTNGTSSIVGTLFGTENPLNTANFVGGANGNFVIDGYSASVVAASTASIDDVFGVSPKGTKGVYTHTFFENHGLTINHTTTMSAVVQTQDFTNYTTNPKLELNAKILYQACTYADHIRIKRLIKPE